MPVALKDKQGESVRKYGFGIEIVAQSEPVDRSHTDAIDMTLRLERILYVHDGTGKTDRLGTRVDDLVVGRIRRHIALEPACPEPLERNPQGTLLSVKPVNDGRSRRKRNPGRIKGQALKEANISLREKPGTEFEE